IGSGGGVLLRFSHLHAPEDLLTALSGIISQRAVNMAPELKKNKPVCATGDGGSVAQGREGSGRGNARQRLPGARLPVCFQQCESIMADAVSGLSQQNWLPCFCAQMRLAGHLPPT